MYVRSELYLLILGHCYPIYSLNVYHSPVDIMQCAGVKDTRLKSKQITNPATKKLTSAYT
jgi:hypothetical protein